MSCIARCTPTLGVIRYEWYLAREAVRTPLNLSFININYLDKAQSVDGQRGVAHARTQLVEAALAYDNRVTGRADWVFFHGDDILVPREGLITLFHTLIDAPPEVGVVSGWYRGKDAPHVPVVLSGRGSGTWVEPGHAGTLTDVFCAGLDCALIRRDVFETLPRPWFDDTDIDIEGETAADDIRVRATEDVFFASRLRQARRRWLVDWRVGCTHLRLDGRAIPAEPEPPPASPTLDRL